MREPIVAGMFYESDFESLDKQVNGCFTHKMGPGDLPVKIKAGYLKAAIAPHAGYAFSGPCAAWVYKEIAESKLPDLFLVLGTSHSGFDSCISLEDWKTPFGTMKNDRDFAKELMKSSGINQDEDAHSQEHSIEVQLPFLQFSCKDYMDKLRFVPLMVSHTADFEALGKVIAETIASTKKKLCIIASSDFTHYGCNYGYVPFKDNIKEGIYELDKKAIKLITGLETKKFMEYVEKKEATICGAYPIATLLSAINSATKPSEKPGKGHLLQYYTSGDLVGDYSNAVGYAAIIFR